MLEFEVVTKRRRKKYLHKKEVFRFDSQIIISRLNIWFAIKLIRTSSYSSKTLILCC